MTNAELREMYNEQKWEARANGIRIGSFKSWLEHRERVNAYFAKRDAERAGA